MGMTQEEEEEASEVSDVNSHFKLIYQVWLQKAGRVHISPQTCLCETIKIVSI